MLSIDESDSSTDSFSLHGDIKPDNILWVQERFKLADPGFARFEKSGRGIAPPLGGTRTYGKYAKLPPLLL